LTSTEPSTEPAPEPAPVTPPAATPHLTSAAPPAGVAAPSARPRRSIRPPDPVALERVVTAALAEDLPLGDPTSEGLFEVDAPAQTALLFKEPGIVCGLPVVRAVFAAIDPAVIVAVGVEDGERIESVPTEIARITGPARAVLAGERTALNLLGRLSGIATLTALCVAELEGTTATLLDTRKTTAGLRDLEKYAVRCGGGRNHRMNLGEALLVKDNHLRLAGGITEAVARLHKAAPRLRLEVEAETLDEVREALEAGVNRILLDNMDPDQLREAVRIVAGRVETEASGGITPANLREVGETGVDFVSLGALTHSVKALDVSLEVVG
jgi:nicotinate-nucleotide pyrophosphorylase (carboxylating)